MAKVSIGLDRDAAELRDAQRLLFAGRVAGAVIAALEESPDQSLVISSVRLANLCGFSWSGNRGTAESLRRRLSGVGS